MNKALASTDKTRQVLKHMSCLHSLDVNRLEKKNELIHKPTKFFL